MTTRSCSARAGSGRGRRCAPPAHCVRAWHQRLPPRGQGRALPPLRARTASLPLGSATRAPPVGANTNWPPTGAALRAARAVGGAAVPRMWVPMHGQTGCAFKGLWTFGVCNPLRDNVIFVLNTYRCGGHHWASCVSQRRADDTVSARPASWSWPVPVPSASSLNPASHRRDWHRGTGACASMSLGLGRLGLTGTGSV